MFSRSDAGSRIGETARGAVSRRRALKWLVGAAGAVAAGPLLAGCGARPNQTNTKELTVVVGLDPGVLDPHGGNAAVSEATSVFGHLFEPLVDVSYEGGKPSFVPMLATEWRALDDTTWEFKLRKDVKFHNGEPFTADAVKFSVERILDKDMKSPATQYIPPSLDRIEIVDPLTVRVITKTPYPMTVLSFSRIRIVPPRYVQEKGRDGFGKAPVGTGPFKYVEWVKDDHTTLEKNPEYWGGAPKVDRLVFKPMPEAGARTAALKSGAADIISLVPVSDIKSIQESQDLQVVSVPSLRSMFVQLDTIADTPLKHTKVRQALNYAVDKDALISNILGGNGVKLDGQLPTKEYFGYNPDLKPFPYDPDKAKALLAEAGFPNGFDITLRGPVGRYMADKELTEAIAGQLEKVGVRAKPQISEWSVYIGELYKRPGLGPMFFLGWAPLPDALGMLTLEESESVVKYHSDPEYDAMVAEAKQTVAEAKRAEIFKRATQWLNANPPVIYLHQQMNIYGAKKSVTGFSPSPDEFLRLRNVSKG